MDGWLYVLVVPESFDTGNRGVEVPPDTAPESSEVQRKIYMTMGGSARLAIAFDLMETARRLAMAGIRSRHPDYTDEQAFYAWARLHLGDEVVREVWPARRLIDP